MLFPMGTAMLASMTMSSVLDRANRSIRRWPKFCACQRRRTARDISCQIMSAQGQPVD